MVTDNSQPEVMEAPRFLFNPPTASEWSEADQEAHERAPWSLRRVMLTPPRARRWRDITRYTKTCARSRCEIDIECYRVVTGTVPVHNKEEGTVTYREDAVYYWPDSALLIEQQTGYTHRVMQVPFCSYKCLSLWSAKIARDSE